MEILTDTAFGLVFVVCTVTLSLGSCMLARRFAGRGPYDRHKEMAGAMAAWVTWSTACDRVLDLVPQTPRQASLRDHMLASLRGISASRDMRQAEAITSVAHFLWIAALSGVVLIAFGALHLCAGAAQPVLLGLFSAYTGAILFLIFGFSNPTARWRSCIQGRCRHWRRSCSLEARALLTRPLGPPR